jgi:hypothetical protein
MAILTADEDMVAGVCLSLVGDAYVEDDQFVHRVGMSRSGHSAIGVAARDIRKGERLAYDPEGNTADIMTKAEFTTARPLDLPSPRSARPTPAAHTRARAAAPPRRPPP